MSRIAYKSTEDILQRLPGRVALVGNGTPLRPFGTLIDRYDTVIRFNNFRIAGYERLIGSKTDFRCTTGWHDIEHRNTHVEFSPFTEYAAESANLNTFNTLNGCRVVSAHTDIHTLLHGIPNPSCGLAVESQHAVHG
jgi:hypothetical protein